MKYTELKNVSKVTIPGLTVEADTIGDKCQVAVLVIGEHRLRIEAQDYYGLKFSIPAPPTMVKRWRVHGTAGALKIDQTFEHKHEASGALDSCVGSLEMEEVEVPET